MQKKFPRELQGLKSEIEQKHLLQKTQIEDMYHSLDRKHSLDINDLKNVIESIIGLKPEEYKFLNECMSPEFKNFKLHLLHTGNKDGFSISAIKNNVGGKSNNLVIITSENGSRFGFFTPVSFSFNEEKFLPDPSLVSFLFSLDHRAHFKLKKDKKGQAVYDHQTAIVLGKGNDVCILDNSNENDKNYCNILFSYGSPDVSFEFNSDEAKKFMAGSRYFKTREIEWYQVHK